MLIEIPRYRVDVTRPADVIEEILRLYGYNNISISEMLNANMPNFENLGDHQISERISNQLVSLGFNEMMNNSISNPVSNELSEGVHFQNGINIMNPLGQELSQMRTSLVTGALEVVAFNLNRQSKSLKLFELGKTYHKVEKGFKEQKYLSLVITGDVYKENWNISAQPSIFYYLKGIINQLIEKNCPQQWEESSSKKDIFAE